MPCGKTNCVNIFVSYNLLSMLTQSVKNKHFLECNYYYTHDNAKFVRKKIMNPSNVNHKVSYFHDIS